MGLERQVPDRCLGPDYGCAPGHLVEAHQRQTHRVNELVEAGIPLSNETMRRELVALEEIVCRIERYNWCGPKKARHRTLRRAQRQQASLASK